MAFPWDKWRWTLDNVNPEEIATAIRQHWSIESNLHWQLDVTFRVDCSKKIQNAPRNFSAVTKIALSVLKNDKITKGSMNLKRLKAGWDEDYLARLLRTAHFNAYALHWAIESMHWDLGSNLRQDSGWTGSREPWHDSKDSVGTDCRLEKQKEKISDKQKGTAEITRELSVSFTNVLHFLAH